MYHNTQPSIEVSDWAVRSSLTNPDWVLLFCDGNFARITGQNLWASMPGLSTDTVPEGSGNQYFSIERAQDAIAAALSAEFTYGKYVRIDTANTIGSPTFTYRSGQEILL